MATLAQINPEAKVYPTLKQVDWRATRIAITERAAGDEVEIYGRDSAMVAYDRRQTLHRALDQICSRQNFTQDKAARLHAALDRLLDEQPGIFGEATEQDPELEEPEEESDDDEPEEAEAKRTAKQHSGSDSVAMDSRRCKECRIVDGKSAPTGKAATVKSIIDFWNANGVHLREA